MKFPPPLLNLVGANPFDDYLRGECKIGQPKHQYVFDASKKILRPIVAPVSSEWVEKVTRNGFALMSAISNLTQQMAIIQQEQEHLEGYDLVVQLMERRGDKKLTPFENVQKWLNKSIIADNIVAQCVTTERTDKEAIWAMDVVQAIDKDNDTPEWNDDLKPLEYWTSV